MSFSALETLLARRAVFLSFVKRRVADPELAEDILQGAYARALEPTRTLPETDEAVTAWFYAVLRHAIIDSYRRRSVETSALERFTREWNSDPNFAEPATPAPVPHFICGCIARVLPDMRPAYAEALREVDLNETPLADFAARHELSVNNATVRLHRARAALRKALQQFCGACTIEACLDCVCKPDTTLKRVPSAS